MRSRAGATAGEKDAPDGERPVDYQLSKICLLALGLKYLRENEHNHRSLRSASVCRSDKSAEGKFFSHP
jgi:hypothetical protein